MSDPRAYIVRLRDDFAFYQREVFHVMGWDKYDPPDEITDDMANWVQHGPKKKITLAPRGDGKTYRITVTRATHRLFCDPEAKVGIISKSEGNAKNSMHLVKQMLEQVPFLQHLAPHGRDKRCSATELDVQPAQASRNPSLWTVGVSGQRAGRRASDLFIDDVEDDDNTITFEARQHLLHQTREFDAICSYGERRIDVVGTYQHEESVYIALQNEGYPIRTWPLVYPSIDELANIQGLSPLLEVKLDSGDAAPGDTVRPGRYSAEYVIEKQARGRSYFLMQYQLVNVHEANQYPLRLEDLIVMEHIDRDRAPSTIVWGKTNGQGVSTRIQDISSRGFDTDGFHAPCMFANDQWHPYQGTKMWIDPSGRGADKTGYAIASYLNGMIWFHDLGGLPGGHDTETLHKLIQIARQYNVRHIGVEDFALQSMFVQLIEPVIGQYRLEPGDDPLFPAGWAASVEPMKFGTGQKELRILAATEGPTQSHRVVIPRRIAENEDFQHQYTRLTRQRGALQHDDIIESFSNAINMWQHELRADPQAAADRLRDRLRDKEIEDFYKNNSNDGRRTTWNVARREPSRWFKHY